MSFNLYDAVVPNWKQTLGAVSALLDKAHAYAADNKMGDSDLVEARLAPDMLPLGFQVKSCVTHSIGAVLGVRKGVFSPDRSPWPDTLAGLKALVTEAQEALSELKADEINGFIGQGMCFQIGEKRIDFTAENFLMSFSVPNFYFHAATAYDILRNQGVALGKLDFLGAMRKKG